MPVDIELDAVDFITVGAIGPKGQRIFYLQAGQEDTLVSLIMEKQQAQALSQAIEEMLDELADQIGATPDLDPFKTDMSLHEPIEPEFRVAQMGLGYDVERDMVVVLSQEFLDTDEFELALGLAEPRTARFWGTREQMRRLGKYADYVAAQGRADPKSNGRVVYYWL